MASANKFDWIKLRGGRKRRDSGGDAWHPSKRAKKNPKSLTDRRKKMIEDFYFQLNARPELRSGNTPANPRWMEELLQKVNHNVAKNAVVSEADVKLWFKKFPEFFKEAEIKAKKRYELSQAEADEILEDSQVPAKDAVPKDVPVAKSSSPEVNKSKLESAKPDQTERVDEQLQPEEQNPAVPLKSPPPQANGGKVFPSTSGAVNSNNVEGEAGSQGTPVIPLPATENTEPVPCCSKNIPKETIKKEDKKASQVPGLNQVPGLTQEETRAMSELVSGIKKENEDCSAISFALVRHVAKCMAKATGLAVKGKPSMDLKTQSCIMDINNAFVETNKCINEYMSELLKKQFQKNTSNQNSE